MKQIDLHMEMRELRERLRCERCGDDDLNNIPLAVPVEVRDMRLCKTCVPQVMEEVREVRESPEVQAVLSLPYSVYVESYDDGTVFAKVLELPGCITECNEEDLDDEVADAIVEWALSAWEDGEEVPMPME